MMFEPKSIINLAHQAGQAIMGVYNSDFAVETKDDASPLTQADLASHQCIVQGLARLTPSIPVLSEESSAQDIEDRMGWSLYWLIDPLDGTKEFVKRNGEFTVNIALIQNHQPIFGVVHAPALQATWWGHQGYGAFKICPDGSQTPIQVRLRPDHVSDWKVVGSRSHQSQEFEAFMQNHPGAQLVSIGSSIKMCLVAEGLPTCIHALVQPANGTLPPRMRLSRLRVVKCCNILACSPCATTPAHTHYSTHIFWFVTQRYDICHSSAPN